MIIFLISGCCKKPPPDIRYIDRNITVNVPVSCEKDIHSDVTKQDSIAVKLAKWWVYEKNVKEACKKLQ